MVEFACILKYEKREHPIHVKTLRCLGG